MEQSNEKRREHRLGYKLPLMFGPSADDMFSQGLMLDIASGGVAFLCQENDYNCPKVGQDITVKFSIPRFDQNDPSATVSIMRSGKVCRAEKFKQNYFRIAIQFDKPLSLKPGEQEQLSTLQNNNS